MNQIIKNIFTITHLWGGIIPLYLLGLWSSYLIISGQAPAWWPMTFLIGYVLTMMVGVGAGWHRLFSHRAFEVSRPVKWFILFCGIISGQGSPIMWASTHISHHRASDRDTDPHSPKDGILHSYLFWMFKVKEGEHSLRPITHLLRDNDIVFVHKYYSYILWSINLIVALYSVDLWLYLIVFPAFITLQVFSIQTSLVHIKSLGYRNYETKDNSVNSLLLFPLTQGEAWHNNHHGESSNPNCGGRHWWEIDPTYWIIKLIKK